MAYQIYHASCGYSETRQLVPNDALRVSWQTPNCSVLSCETISAFPQNSPVFWIAWPMYMMQYILRLPISYQACWAIFWVMTINWKISLRTLMIPHAQVSAKIYAVFTSAIYANSHTRRKINNESHLFSATRITNLRLINCHRSNTFTNSWHNSR